MFAPAINKLKSYPKPNLIFYSLLIMTMIGVIFKVLTPKQSDVILNQNYDGSTTNFSRVVFRGRTISPPKELPQYNAVTWIDPTTLQNQLLASFVVTPDETEPNSWHNDTVSISRSDNPTRLIVLSKNIAFNSTKNLNTAKSNRSIYKDIAGQWVTTHLPNYNLTLDDSGVRFLSGSEEARATTEGLAEIIEMPFAQTAEGYPIRSEVSGGYPLYLWFLTATQEVIKAEFNPSILTQDKPTLVKTISVDQAVSNINSEKAAKVVYAEQKTEQPFVLDQIKRGDIDKVWLEYRMRPNQQLAPFYRFEGSFIDRNDVQISAEIVVPAI